MEKEVKRMVTIQPLVNWPLVAEMEKKGHVFNSWSEYPTFTKGGFEFTRMKSRRLNNGPGSKIK